MENYALKELNEFLVTAYKRNCYNVYIHAASGTDATSERAVLNFMKSMSHHMDFTSPYSDKHFSNDEIMAVGKQLYDDGFRWDFNSNRLVKYGNAIIDQI